ncbi:unnamed protein product [Orchesella dallaii]|uniref:Uncharacterized protein n=1 Tax=Orchesella dallaii TaxID=48710 RepID=A0ABP1RMY1_9HEXA
MQNHDEKLVNEHSEQNLAEEVELATLKIVSQIPKSENPEGMSFVSTSSTASKPVAESSVLGNADKSTDIPE